MVVNPALKLWGSPWTGPDWMKDSAPAALAVGGAAVWTPLVTFWMEEHR